MSGAVEASRDVARRMKKLASMMQDSQMRLLEMVPDAVDTLAEIMRDGSDKDRLKVAQMVLTPMMNRAGTDSSAIAQEEDERRVANQRANELVQRLNARDAHHALPAGAPKDTSMDTLMVLEGDLEGSTEANGDFLDLPVACKESVVVFKSSIPVQARVEFQREYLEKHGAPAS